MALMYDMETVNRAMTEAAKLYDPKHKSAKRVKKVLNIFAGMQAVELPEKHARWLLHHVNRRDRWTNWLCSNCKCGVINAGCGLIPVEKNCPHCYAIMDERVEE